MYLIYFYSAPLLQIQAQLTFTVKILIVYFSALCIVS